MPVAAVSGWASLRHTICEALLAESIPVVSLPKHLREQLLESGAAKQAATPAFVRSHFRLAERDWRTFKPAELFALHPSIKSLQTAIDILYYCMSDLQGK